MFTRYRQFFVSWAKWIQSKSFHSVYFKTIWIFPYTLTPHLWSGLCPIAVSKINPVFMSLFPHTCTCHHTLLDLIILLIFVEKYKPCNSSLCSFCSVAFLSPSCFDMLT
jgi:hypothetical protein